MNNAEDLKALVNSLQETVNRMTEKYEVLLGEAIKDSMDKQRKASGITMSFIVTKWIDLLKENPENVNKVISDMEKYLIKVGELFESEEERDQMIKYIWETLENNI